MKGEKLAQRGSYRFTSASIFDQIEINL
jgi:hypothetical protein